MTPSEATGANTAERAPTTTDASPATIRSRSSRRSASDRPEWRSATASPNRARKRPSDCGLARADVDLRLAAAGRAGQQDVAAAARQERLDPRQGELLRFGEPGGRGLSRKRGRRGDLAPLAAPRTLQRGDQRERPRRGRAVVVGEPEGEVNESRRERLEYALG